MNQTKKELLKQKVPQYFTNPKKQETKQKCILFFSSILVDIKQNPNIEPIEISDEKGKKIELTLDFEPEKIIPTVKIGKMAKNINVNFPKKEWDPKILKKAILEYRSKRIFNRMILFLYHLVKRGNKRREVKSCYDKFFYKYSMVEFNNILEITGVNISDCMKYIKFPDDTPYSEVKDFIRMIKRFIVIFRSRRNLKTELILEIWKVAFNEIREKLPKFNDSQICEVIIDEVKKAIFLGFEEKHGVKYAMVTGYYTEKPVFINSERCLFLYEKVKPIGYDLCLTFWENNAATVEEETTMDGEVQTIESYQEVLFKEIESIYPNQEFWEFSFQELKNLEVLRMILKPLETKLIEKEVEFIEKCKNFKVEPFLKTITCSMILGRNPFDLHKHFEMKTNTKESSSNLIVNPFLKDKKAYRNDSIPSLKKNLILKLKSLKEKSDLDTINSIFEYVNKIINNETNYSSLIDQVALKINDQYYYQIDDVALGLADYPIRVINENNLFPFPNIEYIGKMSIREGVENRFFDFKPEIKCKCDTCNENCPCHKKNQDCHHLCRCKVCENQHKPKVNIEIFQTKKKGWGVRAASFIAKDSYIGEYCGNLITDEEGDQIGIEQDKKGCSYIWDLNKMNLCLDAEYKCNFTRFINHSCDPNVKSYDIDIGNYQRIGFFAAKDIEIGTELTLNYQYDDSVKIKIRCECGSLNCKGYI